MLYIQCCTYIPTQSDTARPAVCFFFFFNIFFVVSFNWIISYTPVHSYNSFTPARCSPIKCVILLITEGSNCASYRCILKMYKRGEKYSVKRHSYTHRTHKAYLKNNFAPREAGAAESVRWQAFKEGFKRTITRIIFTLWLYFSLFFPPLFSRR